RPLRPNGAAAQPPPTGGGLRPTSSNFSSVSAAATTTACFKGVSPCGAGATRRWARAGGGATGSSASTVVPGISPVAPDARTEAGRGFGSISAGGIKKTLPATADADAGARISNNGMNSNNNSNMNSNASSIPPPLDLSAIPGPTPPPVRSGTGGGGSRGTFSTSSGSSSSNKPVVLQGAALESLRRLGRPGSAVSDRSRGTAGSGRGAAGAGMSVPRGGASSTIPMGVPLGSAMPSASSNQSSSSSRRKQQQQQQQHSWTSREVGGKEFHTTGGFPERGRGGVVVRGGSDAAERQAGRAPGGGGGGGGLGSARSESGMSRLLSRRRGMGIGGPPVGKDARLMFHEGSKSISDDMPPPPPSPMLTGHLRRARDSTRGETKQQKQQAEVLPAGGLAASRHGGRDDGGCGGGARPQKGDEDDGLGAAAPPRPGCPAGGALDDDNAHSPSDVPPPPSPMLTGHLRCGPGQENRAPAKLPAGRGRGAFKGRGVRPQTWHEDDRPAEGGGGSSSPRPCGIAAAAGVRQAKGGGLYLADGEAQQQKKQQQQQQQQNQMRLVVRDPKAAAASSSNHDACFPNDQVSPGALSMVSCSTTYSRLSAIGGGGAADGTFNDSDKHLDTLARVAADIARRGASANAELVTGLGRGAFEKITVSPGTRPRRGNDLAGVSKVIPPAAAVASVPSLESRTTAVAAAPTTIGKWTAADAYGARPHVLNSQPSRSELFVDDESSVSSDDDGCSASSGGYSGGVRLEPPSLTVAHAPGRIYQPVTASSQQHQKQVVGRGTPATHSNWLHHHHPTAAAGDGDGAPPFRLPSDMRLMSFGSRASSVVSPRFSGEVELSKVAAAAAAAAAAYDAKSDLARRPTKLEMLSTFGSHSHGRLSGGDAGSGGTDGSHSNAGDEKPRSGGKSREYQRRSSSGTRRSSRREDRISQRRSRSSGSHGGGTRRFNNAGGGLTLAESDKRSGSRDRRLSSSRSISVERPDYGRASEPRGPSGHPRPPTPKKASSTVSSGAGSAVGAHAPTNKQQQQQLRPSSLSSSHGRRRRGSGNGGGRDHQDASPLRSRSLVNLVVGRAGTGVSQSSSHRRSGSADLVVGSRSQRRRGAAAASSAGTGGKTFDWREWRSGGGGKEDGMNGGVAAADSAKTAGPLAEEGVLGDPSGASAGAGVEVVVAAGPSLSSPAATRATSFSKESCRRWSRVLKKPPVAPSNPRPASARKTPTVKKRKVRAFLAIASIFRKKSRGRSGSCSSSSGGSVVGNGGDADDEERTAAAIATAAVGSSCRDGPAGRSSNAGGGGTASSNRSSSINLLRGFNRTESRELTNAAHSNRHGGPGGLVGWLWKRITRQDPPRRRRGRRASGGSSGFGGGGLSPASSSSSGGSSYVSGVSPMITARMGPAGHQQQHGDSRVVLVARGAESLAKSPAGNNPLQNQQPMSVGNPLCALRSKSASHNFKSNGSSICPEQQHRYGSGASVGVGAVGGGGGGGGGGGCITQFYDAPAADDSDEEGEEVGGVDSRSASWRLPSAEGGRRVQQLLRTSQLHMKHRSLHSNPGFAAGVVDDNPTSAGTKADKTAAAAAAPAPAAAVH
ncbi:unnamed protein product, partial [Ectocarpus sp. 13 AM-2016]